MKGPLRCMEQVPSLLLILALLLSLPKTASALFYAHGPCFTFEGSSGTAADAPSYSNLALYRHGLSGQVGRQNASRSELSEEALFPAIEGLPAYFLSDVEAPGQWATPPSEGQVAVAVLECRPGQFGWLGPAQLAWSSKRLGAAEISASAVNFDAVALKPLPKPALLVTGPGQIELRWDAPEDPHGLLSSYTVYRASFPAPAPEYRYAKEFALPKPVRVQGGALAFSNTPPPGIT